MKVILCSDNHFCTTSSVVQGRGQTFSDRLHNQIESLKWVAGFELPVIHLGDFFNRETLEAEEISCLRSLLDEVDFSNWTFLQGNHGYSRGFDVMGIFENDIITEPTLEYLDGNKVLWLPFNSKEEDIQGKYDIIFGHIGVEGIPFGAKGFNPELLEESCTWFFNGHLHNKNLFKKNCLNIGSLTAQNFSDDGFNNEKGIWMLDLKTLEIDFVQNPHAFNFYKATQEDIEKYSLPYPKTACLSISCEENQIEYLREKYKDVYYLRLNIQRNRKGSEESREVKPTLDYLEKFRTSYIEKFGDQGLILEELGEVCR